jgi:hypothetical protein
VGGWYESITISSMWIKILPARAGMKNLKELEKDDSYA